MIEIRITGNDPMEVLGSIGAYGLYVTRDPEIYAAAEAVMKQAIPKPAPTTVTKNVEPDGSIPTAIEKPAVQEAVESPTPVVPTTAPSYTKDAIGKAGADLIAADPNKMPELLALLQKYGVPAITSLAADQLGAFATELRGLGARI